MRWAIKSKRVETRAIELGADEKNPLYLSLIAEGKIKKISDDCYEIFSMEAVNGKGQKAQKGDFIKISPDGYVHPNDREFFLENHKHIERDFYEQIPFPVRVWCAGDEIGTEMKYLLETGQIVLDESSDEKYFNAQLWGTDLSAAKNAYLVMYKVFTNEAGQIEYISFNFVEYEEFGKTYAFIE